MLFETCYICQQTLQPIIYHTICYKGDNPNSKMLIQYILPQNRLRPGLACACSAVGAMNFTRQAK